MLFSLTALGAPPPAHEPPPHVEQWRAQVDWQAAGDEVVEVLAGYLQVDTVNPPGNEAAGADYLAGILDAEGIAWEQIAHDDDRSTLIARLPGDGSEPPLCLMSHLDVAAWEPAHWTHGALSGTIEDGMLYGRGALDMKGMGALEVMTMVWLARLDVPLRRDVILLAVADEEVDNLGMRSLVDQHWGRLGCGVMINEGGLGITDALIDGHALHPISSGEKGILWVRMTARGEAGHGSVEQPDEAPARLLAAMKAIDGYRPRPRIDPTLFELLEAAGRERGGVIGAVLRSKPLVRLLVRPRLMANPATRAALTDTVHLTGTGGGETPNVVPSAAWAQYDCRLLPGTTPESLLAELRHRTRKVEGLSFEVLAAEPSNASPTDDPFFRAIAYYAVEGRPNAAAGPVLTVGFTDSLYARPLGTRAYGYIPFEVSEEVAMTMHGHDERVPVQEVRRGLQALFGLVVDTAARP